MPETDIRFVRLQHDCDLPKRLGGFLDQFREKLRAGSRPEDGCVMCGSTSALLHPVENAWACSKCHSPRGEGGS